MAKELDIEATENLFESSADVMIAEGKTAAQAVLKEFGGIPKILERFPVDRGDANTALIVLLLKLASESTSEPNLNQVARIFFEASLGTPEAIAHAAVFLASVESRYATGAPFLINGGSSPHDV
jgi:NAD(P)-dependent dehydrogenase (short-subunit alcohol dehydrogenase family)